MRPLRYSINVTLDGCKAGLDGRVDETFRPDGDDLARIGRGL